MPSLAIGTRLRRTSTEFTDSFGAACVTKSDSGRRTSLKCRGPIADEWVTQLLRQGDSKVFKKYSQMKLQMKREALQKMNRNTNESKVVVLAQAG